ncbi:MAG: NusG domain II-containing protein [Acholeplasmatales bacterium]|nr:NusG domain II-containing protein [Acholeplasmatales bacterium]
MKRVNDIILIIALLFGIAALFIVFFVRQESGEMLYVNIYHKEDLLYSVPLEKNDTIEINGDVSKMIIIIKNGKVHVDYSGCDSQTCVHEGEKNHEHDVITCLPNKVYIRIGSKLDVNS